MHRRNSGAGMRVLLHVSSILLASPTLATPVLKAWRCDTMSASARATLDVFHIKKPATTWATTDDKSMRCADRTNKQHAF